MPARPRSGPKPKHVEDHIHEGTYRKHRHGPETPAIRKADGRRPPMPQGFNAREKTAWRRLLDGLAFESLLDHADAPLYEAFAVQWARMKEARSAVHKHGTLVPGASGNLVANPAIRIERDATTQVRQLADQLAIGIHTRASLNLAISRGQPGAPTKDEPEQESSDPIGPSPRLQAVK